MKTEEEITKELEQLREEYNEIFKLMAIRTEVLAKIANKLGINDVIIKNEEIFNKIDQLKAKEQECNQLTQTLLEIKAIVEEAGNKQYLTFPDFNLKQNAKMLMGQFNDCLQQILKKINDCKLETNDDITFKELKNCICDDQIGTDELLWLIAEYFNDEEISKGIEQHCKALDETWGRVILYDSVNSSINSYIQAIKQELGRLN